MHNISIVIPNYNGEQLLKRNLPKVLAAIRDYKKGIIEIIIPDDASSDNSVEVIDEFLKSIKDKHIVGKTIRNNDRKKGGFSANVNRGAVLATGDILILLNSDVVPKEGFLEPLVKRFSNSDVFGVGCMDESIEHGKAVLRGRGIGKWQRGFLVHDAGKLDKEDTLWVSCGSAAFRKSIWDKIGGLCNIYNPFYWEDIDLSYRARKAGYQTLFEKKSIVVHEHSKGAIQKNFQQTNINKIVYRNQFLFVWLNVTDPLLIFSHFFWLPYHFVTACKDKNWEMLWGFLHALRLFPQVIAYRQRNQTLFIQRDADVIVVA
jgi:GT2 family glycosyltransferase